MVQIDRRRFLQLAGGAAAATAMSGGFADSIARAASIPAHRARGTIEDVEHIVVLMQENRSFDHYHGSMRGVRGFGEPHPAVLPSGKPVWYQPTGDGAPAELLPFHPTVDDLGAAYLTGTPHSWTDGHAAINLGHYDGWVPAKGTATMAYLQRQDALFHYALADAFTICDAYYCSFIGNTDPNRYYMWTGWTGNDGAGGGPVLYNDELGYDWMTYPERLEAAGISWKVYQDIGSGLNAEGFWGWDADPYIGNYGDTSLLYFNTYRNAQPGDPLYEKARTGTNNKAGQDYFEILAADVAAGQLPAISYVTAPEAFSEHSNWPTNYGAWYISKVLDALTSNPDVWSKTVLFITYDENDGFFDHLVPPHPNTPLIPGDSTVSTEHEFYAGQRLRAAGRPLRLRAAGADVRRLTVEHRWLGVLGDVRPHVDPAVHGATVRGGGAADHAVAACGGRRPDVGVRLRQARPLRPAAAEHRRLRAAGPRSSRHLLPRPAGHRVDAGAGAGRAAGPPDRLRPRGGGDAGRRRDRRRLRQPRLARCPLPGSAARAGRCAAQLHRRRR